jgi:hypothetical protein
MSSNFHDRPLKAAILTIGLSLEANFDWQRRRAQHAFLTLSFSFCSGAPSSSSTFLLASLFLSCNPSSPKGRSSGSLFSWSPCCPLFYDIVSAALQSLPFSLAGPSLRQDTAPNTPCTLLPVQHWTTNDASLASSDEPSPIIYPPYLLQAHHHGLRTSLLAASL